MFFILVLCNKDTIKKSLQQTLDLQRSSLRLGLYAKNSKFMPIKIV